MGSAHRSYCRCSAEHHLRTFAQGGYTVMRRARPAGDVLLAMDHGYLGYLSIAAHGHADALAVWLHLGDRPVLADAGTYLYHSGGAWRTHFRGTAAHNTLCVEGADQSTMSGHFNWSHQAGSKVACRNATTRRYQMATSEHRRSWCIAGSGMRF